MIKRTGRLGLLLGLAALLVTPASGQAAKTGMVCSLPDPTSPAGAPTFNLVANIGDIETPDGNSVFLWSFANQDVSGGHFQSPGPVLCVNEGDSVTIHLHNGLDSHASVPNMVPEPVSIVLPGQDSVGASGGSAGLFTREAAPGGNVTYTFTATHPGTFVYESGTDPSKQLEMGLYGALVVRPAGHADQAYGGASTQFNPSREFLIMLNELDPDLHHAVETGGAYDFTKMHNRYFAVNGREFPDTIQDNGVSWLPNQPYGSLVRLQPYCNPSNPSDPLNPPGCTSDNHLPALIRMINVGDMNHPYHPHGNHLRQIAQDGRAFGSGASSEHFGETIGSGQTEDFLLTWTDQDFWNVNSKQFPNGVASVDYRNLTFKDNNTFFSGSAYLGRKGTLPTGVVQQNVCGEWYFPWHSHALNEFANFDEGFGGMATLMRVDPGGGCSAFPSATSIVAGTLKSGSYTALGIDDATYYQVNPKTTTRGTGLMTAGAPTTTVTSASGFPTAGTYYIRIDNEVLQVTGGQGTTTWTVARGQLGTAAATHASGATITALANDWYAGFTGLPAGAQNLKVSYKGKNCGSTTLATCAGLTTNVPQQTVKVCNWTIAGANGCSSATGSGWVTLPPPPTQPLGIGSTEATNTWTLPGSANAYIGTGSLKGQVRVLVHTQRWSAPSPAAFSTWGNFMQLVYDAP